MSNPHQACTFSASLRDFAAVFKQTISKTIRLGPLFNPHTDPSSHLADGRHVNLRLERPYVILHGCNRMGRALVCHLP